MRLPGPPDQVSLILGEGQEIGHWLFVLSKPSDESAGRTLANYQATHCPRDHELQL